MAMNYFDHQDAARKQTGRLVALFVMAVIAIIVMVYLLVAGVLIYFWLETQSPGEDEAIDWTRLLDPKLLLSIGTVTIVVVGGSSWFKLMQLRGGGATVAEGLGGVRLYPESADANGKKVLNVVEEMAIASGTPVPPVYLLKDERGINAFAAGYSPSDAVIGVTAGAVKRFDRDELQGVIAHEFSHILNGDMRLNIRLIGILHGILVIGLIGHTVLRSLTRSRGAVRTSGSGKNKGGGVVIAIVAIAAGLLVIGYAGTFFGNLIKAAVSRQREFLADASAVQFTRDPEGIADALRRIGGLSKHALLSSPKASEASHMFFGEGISRWTGFFATHPPLGERILKILPSWDGGFISAIEAAETPAIGAAGAAGLVGAPPAPKVVSTGRAEGQAGSAPTARRVDRPALDQIGQPSEAHLAYATELVQGLPEAVREAAHESYGARAVIYAMLINRDPQVCKRQLDKVQAEADPGVSALTEKLLPEVAGLNAAARLPLVDMTVPALRGLTLDQYRVFVRNVDHLVRADARIDLFEWTLRRILIRHVTNQFDKVQPPRVHYYGLNRLQNHCEVLLSTLSYVGHDEEEARQRAFEAGAAELNLSGMALQPADACGLDAVGRALDVLAAIAPKLKRKLLAACGACIAADREVTVEEAEVFRAIADSLDCPVPPLLPGQPLV